MNTTAIVIAFAIGALSPSFIDWQQADARQRNEILAYYAVIVGLLVLGTKS